MNKGFRVYLFVSFIIIFATFSVSAAEVLIDSFESGTDFVPDTNIISVTTSEEHVTEGTKSLKAIYKGFAEGNKAFFKKVENVDDFSGATGIKLDVYTPVTIKFAMFVMIGDGWLWHESQLKDLSKGQHTVEFLFDQPVWKSQATGWNFETDFDPERVVGYGFMIYPAGPGLPQGEIFIDNVRLIKPGTEAAVVEEEPEEVIDLAVEEELAPDSKFNVSGNVEVKVTSEEVTLSNSYPAANMGPGWYFAEGSGTLSVVEVTSGEETFKAIMVEDMQSWATNVAYDTKGADFSDVEALSFKTIKPENWDYMTIQLMVKSGDSWGTTQKLIDITEDGWQTVTIPLAEIVNDAESWTTDPDWSNVQGFQFKMGGPGSSATFYLGDFLAIPEGAEEKQARMSSSYTVNLTTAFQINEDWKAAATLKFSEPFWQLGLVEANGTVEKAEVRGFINGTPTSSTDPLALLHGESFGEDSSFGVEVSGPVEDVNLKVALLKKVKTNLSSDSMAYQDKAFELAPETLLASEASYDLDDLTKLKGILLYETREDDSDFTGGVAVERGFMSGLKLQGQLAYTAKPEEFAEEEDETKDLMGFFASANLPLEMITLEGGGSYYGKHFWHEYADDDSKDPFYKLYFKGDIELADYDFKTGFYINTWRKIFDEDLTDRYRNYYGKIYGEYQANEYISMEGRVELKVEDKDEDEDDVWDYKITDASMLYLQLDATTPVEGLTGSVISFIKATGGNELGEIEFTKPSIISNVTYKPVDGLEVYGEYGLSKTTVDQEEFDKNFFISLTKAVGEGELELSYGKKTLDQDKFDNDEIAFNCINTVDNYYTLKYTVDF